MCLASGTERNLISPVPHDFRLHRHPARRRLHRKNECSFAAAAESGATGVTCRHRQSAYQYGLPSSPPASPGQQSSLGLRAPLVPWPMRSGRTRRSSSRVLHDGKTDVSTRAMALTCLDFVGVFVRCASETTSYAVAKAPTQPTTCARRTSALLSRHPRLISPCPHCLASKHATIRDRTATKRDFAHGDLIPLVRRTNRLPDCGTRADRSTMAWVREERSDSDMPTADRPSCGMPAVTRREQ